MGELFSLKTLLSVWPCQGAVKVSCSSGAGGTGSQGEKRGRQGQDLAAYTLRPTAPEQEEQGRFGESTSDHYGSL